MTGEVGFASPSPDAAWFRSRHRQPRSRVWTLVIAALAIATVAVLVAAMASLFGVLFLVTEAVSESGEPFAGGGYGSAPQHEIDAAIAEIGGPERYAEVRRENVQRNIGTVVTFAPTDEGAGTAQRGELLKAWIERSAVQVAQPELAPFLTCVTGIGSVGQAGRCALGGRLDEQLVEFVVDTEPSSSSCGPNEGDRVELFVGAVTSGEGLPKDCANALTAPTTR